MKALVALVAVALLLGLALGGAQVAGLQYAFGVVVPYAAMAVFLIGIIYRVAFKWGKAPVPFRITTTSGQQKTLPWMKHDKLDNPYTTAGVLGRMALEVLVFRSLFKNTTSKVKTEGGDPRVTYDGNWLLWAAGLAFHWTFLVIVIRHMRFFTEPVPWVVTLLSNLDGFFEIGLPALFISDAIFIGAVSYLFLRRIASANVRYISLPADYFPLFLLLAIGGTGILMRYFMKTDVVGIKELAMGLVTFSPSIPAGLSSMFFAHLFMVSVLLAYFPFSKLMHMPGVFMSPTRNLANNNRAVRHINPWNHPVKVHTYEEWEDDFRDKMIACGLPVDKQPEPKEKKEATKASAAPVPQERV